jgi:hypothetical protein
VFLLAIRGEIVAARIAFQIRDSLYLYYSGFDRNWARYAVMTTTVAEIIKYAIASNLATINLSPGTDVSKTRWPVRRIALERAYEEHPRLRSRLAFAAYYRVASGKMPAWASPLRRVVASRDVVPNGRP